MSRIAVLVNSLESGGGERVALSIVRALVSAGHHSDLVISRNTGVLASHPIARQHGVALDARSDWSVNELLRYYRAAQPDLVIAVGRTAKIVAGMANQLEPSMPLVIRVSGVLKRPRLSRFWLRMAGHWPERFLYRRAIAAVTPSTPMVEEIVTCFGIARDRTQVIHNPVVLDRPPVAADGVDPGWFDRPVIVNIGRLEPQKDQASLLRAFARSGLAGDVRLLILGEGKLEASLRRLTKALGIADAVTFGGYVHDVRPALQRACGFVLSSAHDCFPSVLIEAAAAGIAVAAFDCPTGPREILDEGRLGRLVPPGDIDGLAQAMRDMVSGALAVPAREAVAAHAARFDDARIASEWVSFAEQCLRWAAERQEGRSA